VGDLCVGFSTCSVHVQKKGRTKQRLTFSTKQNANAFFLFSLYIIVIKGSYIIVFFKCFKMFIIKRIVIFTFPKHLINPFSVES
jgi:hypothetical protein